MIAFQFLNFHLEGATCILESLCRIFFKQFSTIFRPMISWVVVTAESFIHFITTFWRKAFGNSKF